MVDDLLGTALDLGVATLHRVEVELGRVGPGRHRRRGPTAHADAHAGPADLHEQRARGEDDLLGHVGADRAEAAGAHDRLVEAAAHPVDGLLVDPEEPAQPGPAELVVEGCRPDRAVEHDLQRARDVRRGTVLLALPGLLETGQVQVGHGEPGEPGLRRRPPAGGALVADLAAGTRGRTREGADRGRVVVRLDLHEHVNLALAPGVAARPVGGLRHPAHATSADHDRGVVLVGDDRALTGDGLGVPDHPEQRPGLDDPVDDEVGVEDLVAAVLGVGLREHHQLDVAGVAPEPGERVDEVVDLVVGQGQAVGRVGLDDRLAAASEHVDALHRLGLALVEHGSGVGPGGQRGFGHPVVEEVCEGAPLLLGERLVGGDEVLGDALHPADVDAAVVRDVGGLARPRRQRPQARGDDHGGEVRTRGGTGIRRPVGQQLRDRGRGRLVEGLLTGDPVHVPRADTGDRRDGAVQAFEKRCRTERREGVAARDGGQHEVVRRSHEQVSPGAGREGGCRGQGYRGGSPAAFHPLCLDRSAVEGWPSRDRG